MSNTIIQPKVRGFICTTAHPTGCAKAVEEEIAYVRANGAFQGPKTALVIGSSTGYGRASIEALAFGAKADTIGVFFERGAEGERTGSTGWYHVAAFEKKAHEAGLYAKSVNGDAFSDEIKQQVIDLLRRDSKKIDLIIYSLASPRRKHPKTGEVFSSVLKPIGQTFTSKTVDPLRGEVKNISIEPANDEEIRHTVAVMGGEDWEMWIDELAKHNLLAPGVKTVAYTYIGPSLTHAVYKDGTIGRAKEDLQASADRLQARLRKEYQGEACISVNKALVTQASAAIPVVPLYIALLFKAMKANGTHEGCIEQIVRLFKDHLYAAKPVARDEQGRIRIDDLEMDSKIQQQILDLWPKITSENLRELTDIEGYLNDFYRLFGFNFDGVDYDKPVNPDVAIDSILRETTST